MEPELEELLGERLGRKVARNFEDHARLAEADRASVARLVRELGGESPLVVPLLAEDVHDLAGLARVNEHLFAADAALAA